MTLKNQRGLHARASAKFCELASRFDAEIYVHKDGYKVRGSSIMGLMTLVAGIGSSIEITASGPDAEEALSALIALVDNRFGEKE